MRSAAVALLGCFLVASGGATPVADAPATPWDAVRGEMRRFVSDAGAPSVSVAVAMQGRIVFAEAAGFADLGRRVAARPDTPYSIASITKPITATALMRLVERGAVGLDDAANRHLGAARLRGWDGDADAVTVRQLLSHTGGLPEHLDFRYADEAPPVPPMATTISRYGVVAFEPGAQVQYANLGYGILASIVSRRSGLPFDEAVRRSVFVPAGMARSAVRGAAPPAAASKRYDAAGHPIPDYRTFEVDGASAAYASAPDLARFGLLHLGIVPPGARRVLSDASSALMQQRATPAEGAAYGLGWELAQERGVAVVLHSGGMPGVRARLTIVPDLRAVIVVLVNGEAWPADLYERLLSIVGLPEETPGVASGGASAAAARPAVPDAFFGAWQGTLRTHEATVPFSFALGPDGKAVASLGEVAPSPVEDLTYADGFLYGYIAGTVPTEDARRRPGRAWVQLRAPGGAEPAGTGALVGVVYQGSAAGERDRYTLGAPVRMTRRP